MLLKALKSNQPYYILFIPLIALGLWVKSFLNPVGFTFYPGENAMILYQPIDFLLGKNAMVSNLMALVFIVLLAFLVLKLNVQYAFIPVRTFLPPTIFVLITSGMHELHAMHPVYPAALFLILTIDRMFNTYDKEVIHSNAFDAGIFLALGSLFYLNLVFLFPLLWAGFIILKPTVNWRDYILSTLGFILPWLAAIAYYLVSNRYDELLQLLKTNFTLHQTFLRNNLPVQIYFGFLALLIVLGSFLLLTQFDGKKISSRRYFKVFFWVFLISGILMIVVPAVSQEIIILLAIPVSFLISNYFIFMKRQIWGEIFLYVLSAGVIYLQFI